MGQVGGDNDLDSLQVRPISSLKLVKPCMFVDCERKLENQRNTHTQ